MPADEAILAAIPQAVQGIPAPVEISDEVLKLRAAIVNLEAKVSSNEGHVRQIAELLSQSLGGIYTNLKKKIFGE